MRFSVEAFMFISDLFPKSIHQPFIKFNLFKFLNWNEIQRKSSVSTKLILNWESLFNLVPKLKSNIGQFDPWIEKERQEEERFKWLNFHLVQELSLNTSVSLTTKVTHFWVQRPNWQKVISLGTNVAHIPTQILVTQSILMMSS